MATVTPSILMVYGYGYPTDTPRRMAIRCMVPLYSPYSSYWSYGYNPYGPIFLSPWQLYGPGPILRMMGVDQWFNGTSSGGGGGGGGSSKNVFHQPVDPVDRSESTAGEKSAPERGTNQHSVDLAKRYIGFGDNHFAKKEYSDALDRYRKAAQAAPQLADAYFRQGLGAVGDGAI